MKITVLVPSEEYKSFAGSRIRYARLQPELARQGVQLVLEDIRRFDPRTADCDLLLISKCHDARSVIAAASMGERGILVAVDLFDDYFSQYDDSRLCQYRNWLAQIVNYCDFALCSTEVMSSVVRAYRKDLPTLILNDPYPPHNINAVPAIVARKVARTRNSGRLSVAWFGVGDNPYFPVGLADLSTYAAALGALSKGEFAVDLTVVTNRRALTSDGLAKIARLAVPTQIREWNEEVEREVLQSAAVAFLPVNAQPFSIAKSLNRALTALASGCQVLSAGYPLYQSLDPLIYRDPAELLAHLVKGDLRLSAKTIAVYKEKLADIADPVVEARNFISFVAATNKPVGLHRPLTLVHGQSSLREAHELVRAADGLSVASPYCTAPFNFDVIFRGAWPDLEMLISSKASERLLAHSRSRLGRRELIRMEQFRCLSGYRAPASRPPPGGKESIAFELATYAAAMTHISERLVDAFGPCRTILSETSQLPFGAVTRGH